MVSTLVKTSESVQYNTGRLVVKCGGWTDPMVSTQLLIDDLLAYGPLVALTFDSCRFRDLAQFQQIICAPPYLQELCVGRLAGALGGQPLPNLRPSPQLSRLAIDFRGHPWPHEANECINAGARTIKHLEITTDCLENTPEDTIVAFGYSALHLVLRYSLPTPSSWSFEHGFEHIGMDMHHYLQTCIGVKALTFVVVPTMSAAQLQSLVACIPLTVRLQELHFDVYLSDPEALDWQAIGRTIACNPFYDLRLLDVQLFSSPELDNGPRFERPEVRARLENAVRCVHHGRATVRATYRNWNRDRAHSQRLSASGNRLTVAKPPMQEVVVTYEQGLPAARLAVHARPRTFVPYPAPAGSFPTMNL